RAAEKAVPPQNEVVQTTLLGGTAHVHATIVYRSRFVAWLPQPISHARRLAASPSRPRRPTQKIPLERPSPHLRPAGNHLVHRRLRSRMFRDGSGLVCRVLSVPQTSRHHLSRLPQRARKSTRLNSSHGSSSYALFCLTKKS